MSNYRTVTMPVKAGDIGALTARIFDPDRTLPIVVLSPSSDTGHPRVPVEMLSHRFTGLIVVLETMAASTALSDEVGNLRVFGGAARVIHPGATREDRPHRHPVYMTFPDQDPRQTADAIVEHVLRVFHDGRDEQPPSSGKVEAPTRPLPKPGPLPVEAPPEEPVQPPEPEPEQPEGAPPVPTATPAGVPEGASATVPVAVVPDDLPEQVANSTAAAVRDLIGDLVTQRDHDLERAVARERARADAAEESFRSLHAEHQALTERFETLRTQHSERRRALEARLRAAEKAAEESSGSGPWPPVVYPDDPEEQFRYEVEQRWLMTYSSEDRRAYPMQEYTVGPGFIESLNADVVPTRKAIDVCVEVVTQRVWATKRCHPVTECGGGSKTRTRPSGETAYRANIKSESPGAPRLMWWQGGNGQIEFAGAAHHDDLSTLDG